MKTKFSTKWISSKQPRKQVKYRANAPLHLKGKLLNVMLSKDLKKKYGKNAIRVKKGDKIVVMRGQYKKKEGKVERVSVKNTKVYVTGIETLKKDGSKSLYALKPSNLQIIELNLDDKKRAEKLNAAPSAASVKKDNSKSENKVKVEDRQKAAEPTQKKKAEPKKEEKSEQKESKSKQDNKEVKSEKK